MLPRPALGRGVFAGQPFDAGQDVELAPVIVLDTTFRDLPLALQRVVFNWSRIDPSQAKFALVLGYGSLYNHSDRPNLRYRADPERQVMVFTAVRRVETGEQLTISYDQVADGASPRRKTWFERNGVEKLDLDESEQIA